jgi:enoyl-CoA hydratase
MSDAYETILVTHEGRVGVITLNRPKALNALNSQVLAELTGALQSFDSDVGVGCILITGSDRAFAAGADIKEMQSRTAAEMSAMDWFAGWDAIGRIRTPIVAAVAGYALGGGCELAMMCDIIIAADTAKFGQPEIKLGVMPGMGGSQRLTIAVGKARAMELCLTGRTIDAAEADRIGLVSRVVPAAALMQDAMATAAAIASHSLPAARAVKEAIARSFELTLAEGLRFERRSFHALFANEDQKEGMTAFSEKRAAHWVHR